MDLAPRLIRAKARQDGTLHCCWYCARPIAFGSVCRTWDLKTREGLSRRYAHDGCQAGRALVGGSAAVEVV